MADIKPLTVNIKNASVADLQAEVAKSKIYEAVLSSIAAKRGDSAFDFSFDLSFSLSFGDLFISELGRK